MTCRFIQCDTSHFYLPRLVFIKACIEGSLYGLAVHFLPDEDEFLHAIAVRLVPVASQVGVTRQHFLQVLLRHGGKPLSGLADGNLTARLLEDVAHVALVAEVTDTLGADDGFRPVARHKLVEASQIHRLAAIPDKCANAVFLGLAFVVVMMVVVFMLVLVVMVVMLVVAVFFLVIIVVFIRVLVVMMLNFTNPCGRRGHLLEIEKPCVEQAVEFHVAIIAVYNLGVRLYGANYLAYAFQFGRLHVGGLIQQDDVAKLYLLDKNAIREKLEPEVSLS